ncbi:MAG: hypothetical protein A2Y33_14355 [Spirochaetes bacterium GWF1_51_8]|nr:MAG: hypothetical protein A2Y33_14355 [Spirochaetes bacterium GWF1_51_8]
MEIIARVNGEEINSKMLDGAVARYIVQLEEDEDANMDLTPEGMKYLRAEVLNYLIERTVLLQAARKDGLSVSGDEVGGRLSGIRAGFDTEADWENNLLALGSNPEAIKDELAGDILLEKFLGRSYEKSIDITDDGLARYFEENQSRMKEPDLFTFYEVMVSSPAQVTTVATVFSKASDVSEIEEKIRAIDGEFRHEADIPAAQLPEEVYNILSDLEASKVGTMVIDDNTIMVYKLIRKTIGKKLVFSEIKDSLKSYLNASGRKAVYNSLLDGEMEKAKIEYVNTDYLKGK